MVNINKTFFICLALIILAILSLVPISSSIKASGIIFDAKAAPGEKVSHEITIDIKNESPADFRVAVVDWAQGPDGSNIPAIDNNTRPYSAKDFLKASPEKFHLEPGESQKIIVSGEVPRDVGDGGRYAIIRVYTVPGGNKIGANPVGMSIGMNTVARITIAGSHLIKTGEITQLKVDAPISDKQQNISIIFNNTGNIHYVVQTEAFLKDRAGNILTSASAPLTNNIIPGALRVFNLSLLPKEPLKPGEYNISAEVRLENSTGPILASKETSFELKE